MNQHLQNILDFLDHNNNLSAEEKKSIIKSLKDADKEFTIIEFKLDRTEKVKKTTSVLLEGTIEELEKKRKDVEAKNKELEIQNALERVRAVALGMKEPADMLEICKTISQQLQLLHVKEIRNVQTAIFYESKGTYMNYEYYAKHDKTIITETSFTNHKMHREFAAQMLKGKDEFFTTHISKTELPDWITYQKTTNVFIDDYLNTATSLNYYWYSLGAVALGISTYEPLKDEDINLFKRFLKVFELSYTRYLDIEHAIAQAREAQIEAALERVRAKTMAMHKSTDLLDVINLLSQQFQLLGFKIHSANFNTSYREKDWDLWLYNPGTPVYPEQIHIPYLDHPFFNRTLESIEKGLDFASFVFTKEEKDGFLDHLYANTIAKNAPQERKKFSYAAPGFAWSTVYLKNTALTIANYDAEPYTEEQNTILRRFGTVFEQSYTRFLDLQKAEAQAREARIEAALEKVRSRSLAVHQSNEFNERYSVFCAPNTMYIHTYIRHS